QQMQGKIDALVLGAGTGGTITGVTRYVKERNPGVRSVLVESEGSVLGGGTAAPHKVEGIGNSFMPKILDRSLIDEVVAVTDRDAFATDAIHAGVRPDPATGSVMTPIYQTSTYVYESPGRHCGYDYARTINPTRSALEENLKVLEGGRAAYAFASGMAAISAVMTLLKSGDRSEERRVGKG